MAITLEKTKKFLHLDFDTDDGYIEDLIRNADEFLRDSINDYDSKLKVERFEKKADLFKLMYIQNLFDNRDLMDDGKPQLKYAVQSMLRQMQYVTYNEVV